MPRYRGWDEKDARSSTKYENGQYSHGGSERGNVLPSYQPPSFTPVNQTRPNALQPSSAIKGPTSGKDSDTLYDIPQDEDPFPTATLSLKRKRQTVSTARNEIKNTPTTYIKQPRHNEDNPISERFASISTSEEEKLSKLSLPLNSRKSTAKRTNSALSKLAKVFPKAGITKLNARQSYDNEIHCKYNVDFTMNTPSTLDKIAQAGHNGLTKTTLEKLAAFKFKNPSTVELIQSTSFGPRIGAMELETDLCPDEQYIGDEQNSIYTSESLFPPDAVEHEVYEDASNPSLHISTTSEPPEEIFEGLFDDVESGIIPYSMEPAHSGSGCSNILNGIPTGAVADAPEDNSSTNDLGGRIEEAGCTANVAGASVPTQDWDEGLEDDDFAQLVTDNTSFPEELVATHGLSKNTLIQFPLDHGSDKLDDGVTDDDVMEIVAQYEVFPNTVMKYQQKSPPNFNIQSSVGINGILPCSSRLENVDDQYPMDGDEAELANLIGLDNPMIVESHSPPSNWVPSDTESRDREVYDKELNHSSPSTRSSHEPHCYNIINQNQLHIQSRIEPFTEPEDWSFLNQNHFRSKNDKITQYETPLTPPLLTPDQSRALSVTDDTHEYLPISPFARQPFPTKVCDGTFIPGLTSGTVLRTCFRIGECLRAGSFCQSLNQDAVIELFCRVTFSSREDGTHKQHFQFADLFNSRPPFVSGVLENYLVSTLQESESKGLLTGLRGKPEMVRCLGRLKRQFKGNGWMLHVDNIRKTDWEEVRWTRRIVGVEEVKIGLGARFGETGTELYK